MSQMNPKKFPKFSVQRQYIAGHSLYNNFAYQGTSNRIVKLQKLQSSYIVPDLAGKIHFIINNLLEYKIFDQNKTVIVKEKVQKEIILTMCCHADYVQKYIPPPRQTIPEVEGQMYGTLRGTKLWPYSSSSFDFMYNYANNNSVTYQKFITFFVGSFLKGV